MFVADGLKVDPDNNGWVLGWGVVRTSPWHLVGVYATRDVAETKAVELGVGYDAAYGSHRVGSDDFVTGTRFLD
ncbi:TPA: hypothetical protein ACTYHK_001698 [Citrobacter koseri]|uniref:hypothetical protein n=1 Tax=Enterobacter hormaechei TaxID=158836 RepID=UPI002929D1EA|nr:hypothetical protein [Enterobacter hormaechei]MDV0400863.1 hypothetical protein [Enterobacter hormaechei]MED5665127.1 hypothetical protein [Enterobacter hormaechei]HCA5905116.1 hypothetical protein [Enterobacter hormaechei]